MTSEESIHSFGLKGQQQSLLSFSLSLTLSSTHTYTHTHTHTHKHTRTLSRFISKALCLNWTQESRRKGQLICMCSPPFFAPSLPLSPPSFSFLSFPYTFPLFFPPFILLSSSCLPLLLPFLPSIFCSQLLLFPSFLSSPPLLPFPLHPLLLSACHHLLLSFHEFPPLSYAPPSHFTSLSSSHPLHVPFPPLLCCLSLFPSFLLLLPVFFFPPLLLLVFICSFILNLPSCFPLIYLPHLFSPPLFSPPLLSPPLLSSPVIKPGASAVSFYRGDQPALLENHFNRSAIHSMLPSFPFRYQVTLTSAHYW